MEILSGILPPETLPRIHSRIIPKITPEILQKIPRDFFFQKILPNILKTNIYRIEKYFFKDFYRSSSNHITVI